MGVSRARVLAILVGAVLLGLTVVQLVFSSHSARRMLGRSTPPNNPGATATGPAAVAPGLDAGRIPRIIHQTWKTSTVSSKTATLIRTFILQNPGWEYRLWTDADCRRLVAERYPEHLALFDGYGQNIKRADAIRYFILHSVGGLYADLDFEALRSLEPLVANYSLVLGQVGDSGHSLAGAGPVRRDGRTAHDHWPQRPLAMAGASGALAL